MLSSDNLRAAKKAVKMIATAIVEGLVAKQTSVEFKFNDETVKILFGVSIGVFSPDKLHLFVYRDGVSAYTLKGSTHIISIKEMASDLYFLLDAPCIEVKI